MWPGREEGEKQRLYKMQHQNAGGRVEARKSKEPCLVEPAAVGVDYPEMGISRRVWILRYRQLSRGVSWRQPCFNRMTSEAWWIGGGDRETKPKTTPLKKPPELQPLKICSSVERGQASPDKTARAQAYLQKMQCGLHTLRPRPPFSQDHKVHGTGHHSKHNLASLGQDQGQISGQMISLL